VGIKLSSVVRGIQTNAALVELTSNLNVSGGPHELQASEGSWGDDAGAMTEHGAVSDDSSLNISNQSIGGRGSPKTEVFDGVDEHGLALGVGPLRCAVANIVTRLRSTANGEWVDLLRDVRVLERVLRQGEGSACRVRNGDFGG